MKLIIKDIELNSIAIVLLQKISYQIYVQIMDYKNQCK